jgi:ABC-type amino acid transport system permease subunit
MHDEITKIYFQISGFYFLRKRPRQEVCMYVRMYVCMCVCVCVCVCMYTHTYNIHTFLQLHIIRIIVLFYWLFLLISYFV